MSSSSIIFDTIIISSPNEEASEAALKGPLSHSIFQNYIPQAGENHNDQDADHEIDDEKKDENPQQETQSSSPTTTTKRRTKNHIISTSDPFNVRMGSGGGTLAAISQADQINRNKKEEKTILIIHAGGESSRCPTQMCLGKAWTTLPLCQKTEKKKNMNDGIETMETENGHPTGTLLSSLETLLQNSGGLPKGSIVVAASDVLLSLPPASLSNDASSAMPLFHSPSENNQNDSDSNKMTNNAVVGLAVPAPLQTAKNHGVFVVNHDHPNNNTSNPIVQSVTTFLQKPSIDTMHSTPGCTFSSPSNSSSTQEEMVWIDTGIVIFLPPAAQRLRSLCQGSLSICTKVGLEELYHRLHRQCFERSSSHNSDGDGIMVESMESFANRTTAKVDLYSHLLLALSTLDQSEKSSNGEQGRRRRTEYLSHPKNVDLDQTILESIYDALSDLELKVCLIPSGTFIHLGTTRELQQFLIEGVKSAAEEEHDEGSSDGNEKEDTISDTIQQYRNFGKQIGLVKRSCTFLNSVDIHNSSVVVNSIICTNLPTTSDPSSPLPSSWIHNQSSDYYCCTIGKYSVLEHCKVSIKTFKLSIGSNCLVSGLRGKIDKDVTIPSDMMFQMVPLKKQGQCGTEKGKRSHVYIYLGINDGIKTLDMWCGVAFERLLSVTGLSPNDLWEDINQTLWTAKIHTVHETADPLNWDSLDWVAELVQNHTNDKIKPSQSYRELSYNGKASLNKWKSLKRLSLSEIRQLADVSYDFFYRDQITKEVPERQTSWLTCLNEILDNRLDKYFDFSFVLDDVKGRGKSKGCSSVLQETLHTLDSVILSSISKEEYDIGSRAFMLMSDLCRSIGDLVDDINERVEDQNFSKVKVDDVFQSQCSSSDQKIEAYKSLFQQRDRSIARQLNGHVMQNISEITELIALSLTELCVAASRPPIGTSNGGCNIGTWAVATAPARIDLSGGWSDTPPISYENGGAVACLAVNVDGLRPLCARCRKINSPGIFLCVESRDNRTGALLKTDSVNLTTVQDLTDFSNPDASCALLKCAFICLGLVPVDIIRGGTQRSLQSFVHDFCGYDGQGHIGLELISTSLLPKGSGMGTSSILGACILSAIKKCVGLNSDDNRERRSCVEGVLCLEQLLSTGGGWQDQIGGVFGGLKLGTSEAKLPLKIDVKHIPLSDETHAALNDRLILGYSGQPRLAKNILQKVLREWSQRRHHIVKTVNDLQEGAHKSVKSIQMGDLGALGSQMSMYWSQKKNMTGSKDSGVEPEVVRLLLDYLQQQNMIEGGTLVGAGGGGFLALLLKEGLTLEDIKSATDDCDFLKEGNFSWHNCSISSEGLRTFVGDDKTDFDIDWQK